MVGGLAAVEFQDGGDDGDDGKVHSHLHQSLIADVAIEVATARPSSSWDNEGPYGPGAQWNSS